MNQLKKVLPRAHGSGYAKEIRIRRDLKRHSQKSKIFLIHRLWNLPSQAEICLSNLVKMAFSLGSNA